MNDSNIFSDSMEGNVYGIKTHLENGVDINSKELRGNTPLHLTSRFSYEATVFLLENGADIEAVNSLGEPPLITSFMSGNTHIMKVLLENGADLSGKNYAGNTLLHRSIIRGNFEMVELLVKYGADIEAVNNNGQAPSFLAKSVKREKRWKEILDDFHNSNSIKPAKR